MNWNNAPKQKKEFDNFWLGFIPSFLLPVVTCILYFKLRYTTSEPLFSALYDFILLGRMGKTDLISCLLPSLILIAVFSIVKKEKAMIGCFVGVTPALIAFFLAV